MLAIRMRGGIGPTVSWRSCGVHASIASTAARVGGVTGRPSLQPCSKKNSSIATGSAFNANTSGKRAPRSLAADAPRAVNAAARLATTASARAVTASYEALCIGCGISTTGRFSMPRPAACLRAACAKAVLHTVTVGTPNCSSFTPSATLTEQDVPQSPKPWITASLSASARRSASDKSSLGASLRTVAPVVAP